ncbi:TonB-dependent receptor [Salmonirosea aquatica]|uniref:TonB-dependent receptor plug domain-containing protein n=1 Tax=Salmonirosea aquatica TaxID=2654236 RepID=A0A7C9BH77_9BACT|nr:TonB-dependent receptor plug domain-containing protein [Cytophagaceae bacterium SJW1-29]
MKKIYELIVILAVCWLAGYPAMGQNRTEPLINGQFNDVKFKDFVKTIEGQTDYYFYYDAAKLDNLQIYLQVQNQPLRTVLAQVFKDTEYTYAIDSQNRVFVTKGTAIITQLPTEASNQEAIAYAPPGDEQEKLLATAENKLYEVGPRKVRVTPGNSTVSGFVRNAVTGEPVIGAAVFIDSPQIGVTTDVFGYYSLSIPRGRQRLRVRSIGMRETFRQIMLYSDGKLDIEVLESVTALKEVAIKAGQDANVASSQMGQVKLSIKTLKQVPTVMGETDLLRTVMTLPGVKSVGESSVGLNVRGGSADQNLILFNDATVYNPSHLFGFFSAFNPDILKDVELYKSSIPARLGGRLSSVLDISSRDGNKKKFVGSGGIGLITGRLSLEGPIVKDKSSFIIGGRSTYSNWLLKRLDTGEYNKSTASFYDVNAHISHEINEKNSVYVTGYLSRDRFRLFGDTIYAYQNQLASLKWKHTFNAKLYGTFTAAYTSYQYAVASIQVPLNAFDLKFGIKQASAKAEFSYLLDARHTLDFGLSTIRYGLSPGTFQPRSSESLILPDKLEAEQGQESAVYIEDRFEVNPRLLITAGLRFSVFNYLGPKTVNQYLPGQPIDKLYEAGTQSYAAGKFIKTYGGPEYRISVRRMLTGDLSLKVSYNTLRQYIHLLSNTMVASPTDIWKLSDGYIKPQLGDQIAVGLYRNLRGNQIELSVEGYYKNIRNFLDYKGGDSLIMNPRIEAAVISTRGKAYGIELMLRKMTGKLNGWVGYTYSRSLLRALDRTSPDAPNDGNYYPSNYDKPHDFTAITNYRLSHRFSVSFNFTYSTGRPYTPPIGKYTIEGAQRIYYAARNQYRIPDYYRVDMSMNIEGNHKIKKLAHSSWTVAVYNLLGRKNPSSVYFQTRGGVVNGYKLSIFGQPIPTITYNFRF